eukprot:4134933-Amphidinium_carterae.1
MQDCSPYLNVEFALSFGCRGNPISLGYGFQSAASLLRIRTHALGYAIMRCVTSNTQRCSATTSSSGGGKSTSSGSTSSRNMLSGGPGNRSRSRRRSSSH